MLEYILLGGGFAFAAAVQPGPLQVFFLASVARNGWQRTLPAALAPIVSDLPIVLGILFYSSGCLKAGQAGCDLLVGYS